MNPEPQCNPSGGTPPGQVELTLPVAAAFAAARAAQPGWARRPVAQRLERVRSLRQLIAANALGLAEASAAARRRPTQEALTAEVLPLVEACRFLEREAQALLATRRLGPWGRPLWLAGVRSRVQREPFGVVLIIGPGNYPLLLPGVQMLQALVAGNSVVLKPGVGGTAAAQALLELLRGAGFPADVVRLLPESADAARAAIAARPDQVLFTGSAAVGEQILAQSAPQLTPAILELSGCDAVIVRADAELDLVANALAFGLRLNNGATCLAPKRVFVARGVATELEGRLARLLEGPECARPGELQTPQPKPCLQNPGRSDTSELLRPGTDALRSAAVAPVHEALAQGAHVIAGALTEAGAVHLPLVLGGVSAGARLLQTDLFLPVLSLVTVADDREAVRRSNACAFALGASVFSRDEAGARSLAASLNAGVVSINDLIVPTADARLPFGGCRRSGFGVTRGAEGLLALTRPKVVTVTHGRFRPASAPARPGDEQLFQAYLECAHGRGLARRGAALATLLRGLWRRRTTFFKEL